MKRIDQLMMRSNQLLVRWVIAHDEDRSPDAVFVITLILLLWFHALSRIEAAGRHHGTRNSKDMRLEQADHSLSTLGGTRDVLNISSSNPDACPRSLWWSVRPMIYHSGTNGCPYFPWRVGQSMLSTPTRLQPSTSNGLLPADILQ